jgi:hypothetical protein
MNKIVVVLMGLLLMFASCSPKIGTSISKHYPALDYREDIRVFGLQDPIPAETETIGTVKIGDTGFSTNCGWEEVIDKAKLEARKAGGNAIKITKHSPPSTWGSSCHRITAAILRVDNLENYAATEVADSSLIGADYALLHVYRHGGTGALINFDLHLGDSVICRVGNKWKETVKINREGLNVLWARTETKTELPIYIELGQEYYIRCSIKMGAFVGRPQIELVHTSTGKAEFQSIPEKKK